MSINSEQSSGLTTNSSFYDCAPVGETLEELLSSTSTSLAGDIGGYVVPLMDNITPQTTFTTTTTNETTPGADAFSPDMLEKEFHAQINALEQGEQNVSSSTGSADLPANGEVLCEPCAGTTDDGSIDLLDMLNMASSSPRIPEHPKGFQRCKNLACDQDHSSNQGPIPLQNTMATTTTTSTTTSAPTPNDPDEPRRGYICHILCPHRIQCDNHLPHRGRGSHHFNCSRCNQHESAEVCSPIKMNNYDDQLAAALHLGSHHMADEAATEQGQVISNKGM